TTYIMPPRRRQRRGGTGSQGRPESFFPGAALVQKDVDDAARELDLDIEVHGRIGWEKVVRHVAGGIASLLLGSCSDCILHLPARISIDALTGIYHLPPLWLTNVGPTCVGVGQ